LNSNATLVYTQARRSNRVEAKAWLQNSLAALPVDAPAVKRRRLAQFLPGGSAWRRDDAAQAAFGEQLLKLVFEQRAPQVRCRRTQQQAAVPCRPPTGVMAASATPLVLTPRSRARRSAPCWQISRSSCVATSATARAVR
jgi:hypothetical protein